MNQTTLKGNVGKEPELRFTQSGKAVMRFSVATSYKKGNSDEWGTRWFPIVAWDKLAEAASECVHKGTRVVVIGKSVPREYTDTQGQKRSITEVVADVIALDGIGLVKKDDSQQQAPPTYKDFEDMGQPIQEEIPF